AEASTQVLTLRGLDTEELRAVVGRQLRHEVSADGAELLRERSAGNPSFALELASLLGGDARGLAAEPSPDLGALIERRAALLSPDARTLLRAAAALGTEFDPNVLREAEGCTPRALAHALDQAAMAGLLEPPGRTLRRFAHPLLAEALYAELAADKRAASEQHLRIPEAFERLGPDQPFAPARHLSPASPAADAAGAPAHGRAAAEAARGGTAAEDADFWYGHAIPLAEAAGEGAAVVGDLLVGLAIVRLAVTGLEAARVPAERAAQLALAED